MLHAKKLVGTIAAHKGVFTKTEPKIEQLLFYRITSKEVLFEIEPLVATIGFKSITVRRKGTDTERVNGHENQLAAQIESKCAFDEKVSIPVGRREALCGKWKFFQLNNCKSARFNVSKKVRVPRLQLPSFTGSYTNGCPV